MSSLRQWGKNITLRYRHSCLCVSWTSPRFTPGLVNCPASRGAVADAGAQGRVSGPCQMFRNISSKLVKRVWALSVSIDYMISMIRSALVDMWCNITLGLRPGLVIYTPYHSMHAYLRTYVRTYWPGCLPDFTVCQGAHLRHRHVPKLFTHSQYSQQHFWHNVAQFPYILKWVIHHHALVLLFSQHCHVRIRVRI